MKKRFILMGCLCIVMICAIIFLCRVDAMLLNGLRVLSPERLAQMTEQLSEAAEPGEAADLLELDGSAIPYDKRSNTFYVGQSATGGEYTGTFQVSKKDCSVYIQEDKALQDKQKAIAEGHVFHLWFVMEDTYIVSDLVFTGLPMLRIDSGEGRLTADYGKGRLVVHDPDREDIDVMSVKESEAEFKENYQSGVISFKLYEGDFQKERNLRLAGLDKHSSWKLYPVHEADVSAVREMLAAYVWNVICTDGELHREMEYAEVIADGEYLGLYYLVPKVGKGYLKLKKDDRVYKLEDFSGDGTGIYEMVGDEDTPENRTALEEYESLWEAGTQENTRENMYSGTDGEEQEDPGERSPDDAERNIDVQKDVPVSIENCMDYQLWLQAVCGIRNSTQEYYVIASEKKGQYIFRRMPTRSKYVFGIYPSGIGWQSLTAAEAVLADEPYDKLVEWYGDSLRVQTAERWQELRKDLLDTEALLQYQEQCAEQLAAGGYAARSGKAEEYEKDVLRLRTFIGQRMDCLDRYFGTGETENESKEENGLNIGITISGDERQRIRLWQDGEKLYAFLPAAADLLDMQWSYDESNYEVNCAGKRIMDGDPFVSGGAEKDTGADEPGVEMEPHTGTDGLSGDAESDTILQITDKASGSAAVYQLCVMQSENLPAVFISTQSGSMEWLHMDKKNYESGEMVSLDEKGQTVYAGGLVKISGRGNSSWVEEKRSYTIALPQDTGLAGMSPAKKWVLQANALDATRMRNKITYDIARDMGLQYAVDSAYADVWLNGVYAGNYLVCEKIETGKNRVELPAEEASVTSPESMEGEETEPETGKYIRDGEGAWWEYDLPQGQSLRPRDGYLLEFNDRIGEDEAGYFMAGGRQVEFKSPQNPTYEEYRYIKEYSERLLECTERAEQSDEYLEYIDLESWSLLYLINELTNDTDANRYSVFYYKDKGTKLFAGPIWDYDIAWGNDFLGKDVRCSFFRNGWYGTLYDNKTFYNCLTGQYESRMRPELEKLLEEDVDTLRSEIRSSIEMDDVRWAHSDSYTRRSDLRDWDQAVDWMKDYMENRTAYFNEVWLSGDLYHRVCFYDGDMMVAVTYVKDGEQIPEDTLNYAVECLAQKDWRGQDGETYDRSRPVETDLKLYAQR